MPSCESDAPAVGHGGVRGVAEEFGRLGRRLRATCPHPHRHTPHRSAADTQPTQRQAYSCNNPAGGRSQLVGLGRGAFAFSRNSEHARFYALRNYAIRVAPRGGWRLAAGAHRGEGKTRIYESSWRRHTRYWNGECAGTRWVSSSSHNLGLSGNNTQKPLVPVDGLRGLDRAPPTSAAMPVPAALLSRSSLTAPRSLARAPLPPLSRPASPRTTAKRSWRSLSTPPTPSYPPSPPRPPPDASAPRYEGGADGRRPGPTSRPPTPPPTPKIGGVRVAAEEAARQAARQRGPRPAGAGPAGRRTGVPPTSRRGDWERSGAEVGGSDGGQLEQLARVGGAVRLASPSTSLNPTLVRVCASAEPCAVGGGGAA